MASIFLVCSLAGSFCGRVWAAGQRMEGGPWPAAQEQWRQPADNPPGTDPRRHPREWASMQALPAQPGGDRRLWEAQREPEEPGTPCLDS